MRQRKKLALLCAHIPHLDPRIGWMADTLSQIYSCDIYSYASYYPMGVNEFSKKLFLKNEHVYQRHNVKIIEKKLSLTKSNAFTIALHDAICYTENSNKKHFENLINIINKSKKLRLETNQYTKRFRKALKSIFATIRMTKSWHDVLTFYSRLYNHCSQVTINDVLAHFKFSYLHLWDALSKLTKYDVICCADLDTLLIACHYKLKYNCTIIYDCHEIYWASRNNATRDFEITTKLYEKSLIQHVDKIITVTPQIRNYFIDNYNINPSNIIAIPNASPVYQQWQPALHALPVGCRFPAPAQPADRVQLFA